MPKVLNTPIDYSKHNKTAKYLYNNFPIAK